VPASIHREMYIRDLVKAKRTRRETEREADKVLTKPLNQVDERRNPRMTATVNQLLWRPGWLGFDHGIASSSVGMPSEFGCRRVRVASTPSHVTLAACS
jgi:hypothetical protein